MGIGNSSTNNYNTPLPPCAYETIVSLILNGSFEYLGDFLESLKQNDILRLCSEPYFGDSYHRTILHHCAWTADEKALKLIFNYCDTMPNLEAKDLFNMTPLAASINRSNFGAAHLLLSKGASINCDSHNGYYLMRAAVFNENPDLIQLLVKYNCSIKLDENDYENGSLLHIACDSGNLDVISCLIEVAKVPIDIKDKYKIQVVHIAASKNNLELLKYLDENGADLSAEDIYGNVPAGWAKFCDAVECFDYLIERKANCKEFHEDDDDLEEEKEIFSTNIEKKDDNDDYSVDEEKKSLNDEKVDEKPKDDNNEKTINHNNNDNNTFNTSNSSNSSSSKNNCNEMEEKDIENKKMIDNENNIDNRNLDDETKKVIEIEDSIELKPKQQEAARQIKKYLLNILMSSEHSNSEKREKKKQKKQDKNNTNNNKKKNKNNNIIEKQDNMIISITSSINQNEEMKGISNVNFQESEEVSVL